MTYPAVRKTTAVVFGLCAAVTAVEGAEPDGIDQSAQAARFLIVDARVQASPQMRSTDHRFEVTAALRAASGAARRGGAFELNARLVNAVATACTLADLPFANGFE